MQILRMGALSMDIGPFTFTTEIEPAADLPVELVVTYTGSPIIPARTYGPPEHCYPAEGGEVEIQSVMHNGQPYALTDEQEEALLDVCSDRVEQDAADAEDDRADYEYDRRRDEQMMREWEE